MKNNINITSLKKTIRKGDLIHYYISNNSVIFWNTRGCYAAKISISEFELIQVKLSNKLKQVNDIPVTISNAIANIVDNTIINSKFMYNWNNNQYTILKNKRDFVPVDNKYLNIINDINDISLIKQDNKYSPIQFINDHLIIIIMPCRLQKLTDDIFCIFQ